MKIYLIISTMFLLFIAQTNNCLALEPDFCQNLLQAKKKSPPVTDVCGVVESVIITAQYENIPPEYSSATGIIKYYIDFQNPVASFINDYILTLEDGHRVSSDIFARSCSHY